MKKQDILIIVALVALAMLWGVFDSKVLAPRYPARVAPTAAPEDADPQGPDVLPDAAPTVPGDDGSPPPQVLPGEASPVEELQAAPVPGEPVLPDVPETVERLTNDRVDIEVSSLGGGIRRAHILDYRAENTPDSGPVELDFGARRALVLRGVAELGAEHEYRIERKSEDTLLLHRSTSYGIRIEREIKLGVGYTLQIRETLFNETDQALQLPVSSTQMGLMANLPGETVSYGMAPLGVDILPQGEVKATHFGRKLPKLVKNAGGVFNDKMNTPVDWLAVKNKYFLQSLIPEVGAPNYVLFAHWNIDDEQVDQVSGSLLFDEAVIQPGRSVGREMIYYVGPKKLSELKALGHHMHRVMELGWWFIPYVGQFLLVLLNSVEGVVGNYGIAIMLVTLIIRILFWPLTHRGTESMRRMQELSPQMKLLNEKYKEDPQRKQQELMKFYKENKINPLGGCLPMLIQFPFFIGLFYVLRSAIELRFAGFLWIQDLSEPDRLFTFSRELPFIGDAFNILPIIMAVSMYLQQKIAPTSAATDEKQQQMQQTMMRMMPFMMLIMLYKFAAGLALYWSTQNFLMIAQQLIYRKRKAMKEAQAEAV